MKSSWKLLLLLNFFIYSGVFADEPPLLKPKLRAKNVVSSESGARFRFELAVVTPLGKEDFYETRFSAIGGSALFSIPILSLSPTTHLYGTLGFLLSYSRLSLHSGETQFSSMYFQFPLLGKVLFSLSREIEMEIFLGAVLRTTRYDSRSTTDGGFQKVTSDFVLPEGGVAFAYKTSESSRIKLKASYLYLGIGGEFLF